MLMSHQQVRIDKWYKAFIFSCFKHQVIRIQFPLKKKKKKQSDLERKTLWII